MPIFSSYLNLTNLPTHDSHLGCISKLTNFFLFIHTFPAVGWFHPVHYGSALPRAHVAGNAWLIWPWANRPGWMDPHIGITVKTPKTHLIGRIRPQNFIDLGFGTWFSLVKWYLWIFTSNLNKLRGFAPCSQCGGQFALVGWTWPTLEP
jgi:hypothetical protein